MAEDAAIRLENLRRILNERRPAVTGAELARRMGVQRSYTSELLAGRKSFGEKVARTIEAALDLPRGWLDNATDEEPVPSKPPAAWPFELISEDQWSRLTERQRGAVEAAAVAAMRDLALDVPEAPSRKRRGSGA